jgi:phosphohistidine phosphatase
MSGKKTLFVLRHSKSSWDDIDKSDFDRPLQNSGIKDARKLSNALKNELRCIDKIVTSPANRAIHTAILLCEGSELPLNLLSANRDLYESSLSIVKRIVSELPNEKNCILIVGHNPTFTDFVNRYLTEPIDNLPTTGLVKLVFDTNTWEEMVLTKPIESQIYFPKSF